MATDQEIQALTEQLKRNPGDVDTRRTLGGHLLPVALENWPSGENILNLNHYRTFLRQVALPIAELLEGVDSLEVAEFIYRIAGALHWLGEHVKSESFIARGQAIRERIASRHPLYDKGIRFFQTRTGIRTQFGHLAIEPDAFVRGGRLGWRPPHRAMLLMPDGKSPNGAFLRAWRKEFCVVTEPELCRRLEPLSKLLEYDTFWLNIPHIGVRYGHTGIMASVREWEKRKLPPVMTLDPRHKSKGWKILEERGVPKDTWFALAHVRYAQPQVTDKLPIRNANLETYLDAFKEIVQRGGVVIRIGGPEMPKLPPIDGVFDFAHGERCPDWFDLFVNGECRFFLGSASGPSSLAATFARPLIMSNAPANAFPVSANDIFLPKLLREKKTGRLLTFRETFVAKFQFLFNGSVYEEYGVEHVDNEADDILNAVREMCDRLEGKTHLSEDDLYLQSRFDAMASALEGMPITCGVSPAFARKHRALIEG